MQMKLLIADDNCAVLNSCLQPILRQLGTFDIKGTETPEGCLRELGLHSFDVVLLDISFSPGQKEGLKLIPAVKRLAPSAEIIMLTSFDDRETIAQCRAAGANDYISKNNLDSAPQMVERLEAALNRRTNKALLSQSGVAHAQRVGASFTSKAMHDVYAQVAKIRNEPKIHVLITGPTGAGKELVAKAIGRADEGAPFKALNCSCFGKELLESELFGHERGSFTGAERQKLGMFEVTNGGDIFFDEVATLPMEHQTKLLRVLQSGEYYRTGGTQLYKSTARVIAATNQDLDEMVKQGTFRQDLLMRFKRFHIEIPALIDRKEDIPNIIKSVIAAHKSNAHVRMTDDCLSTLLSYDWPNNVRELENCITAMLTGCNGKVLTIGDMPDDIFKTIVGTPKPTGPNGLTNDVETRDEVPMGLSLQTAQRNFTGNYIKATAARMPQPLTIERLARALEMPKSTLGKKLIELGICINTVANTLVEKEEEQC